VTGAGITLYLLYLQSYHLAALTVVVFAPLIGFHFTIDRLSSNKLEPSGRLVRINKDVARQAADEEAFRGTQVFSFLA